MQGCLSAASADLSTFVESRVGNEDTLWLLTIFMAPIIMTMYSVLSATQMLTKAGSLIAIVYFGTQDTDNDLHDESVAAGDEQQYRYITVKHPFENPGLAMLQTLRQGAR